jgi:hypothetical protein
LLRKSKLRQGQSFESPLHMLCEHRREIAQFTLAVRKHVVAQTGNCKASSRGNRHYEQQTYIDDQADGAHAPHSPQGKGTVLTRQLRGAGPIVGAGLTH